MIDVDYNEYKKTIAENMELIVKNHYLKEQIEKTKKFIKENYSNIEGEIWHKEMEKIFYMLGGNNNGR